LQRLVQKEEEKQKQKERAKYKEEKEEWEKSVQKYIKAKLGNRGQLVLNAQNEFLETFSETGNERKIAEGAPFLTMESIRWFPKAQDVVENGKKRRYPPHFTGRWKSDDGTNKHEDIHLSKHWCNFYMSEKFLYYVQRHGETEKLKHQYKWISVPVGSARESSETDECTPPRSELVTDHEIKYMQGKDGTCLFSSIASALHYLGFHDLAATTKNLGKRFIGCPLDQQTTELINVVTKSHFMIPCFKTYYQRKCRSQRHKKALQLFDSNEYDAEKLYGVVLKDTEGYNRHAVAIVDNLIFDSTHTHALVMSKKSLDWCCNCEDNGGFESVFFALRFSMSKAGLYQSRLNKEGRAG